MRNVTKQAAILVAVVAFAVTALSPVMADSQQKNKNLWRNGAIAGGAVALYGLAHHNTTTTVLGVAGAAYSAHRYEQDRHNQSRAAQRRAWYRRHHRHHRVYHHAR